MIEWFNAHPKLMFFLIGNIAGLIECVIYACFAGRIFYNDDD